MQSSFTAFLIITEKLRGKGVGKLLFDRLIEVCKKGNYSGPQSVVYYNAPPPPAPIVSLTTSPSILARDGRSIVRWNVQYPTNVCTLTAKVVCANNVCSAAQTAYENAVNQILTSSSTDSDDPSTSRLISTAVQTIAP